MLDAKDIRIINELRKNSREKLDVLARKTAIPKSTLHERLKRLRKYIRMISIPCFRAIHLPLHCWAVIQTHKKEQVLSTIHTQRFVNTVLCVNNGADIIAECVFPGFAEQYTFEQAIKQQGKIEFYPVLHVIAREKARL